LGNTTEKDVTAESIPVGTLSEDHLGVTPIRYVCRRYRQIKRSLYITRAIWVEPRYSTISSHTQTELCMGFFYSIHDGCGSMIIIQKGVEMRFCAVIRFSEQEVIL
jgi:hypothetical protein